MGWTEKYFLLHCAGISARDKFLGKSNFLSHIKMGLAKHSDFSYLNLE